MRIKLLLSLLTVCSLCVKAQTYPGMAADESITISKDSTATVLGWFNVLERKGKILSYSPSDINLKEKIKINRQNLGIREFLDKVLYRYDHDVNSVSGNKILIRIKGIRNFMLKGHVSDIETGEDLDGCTIVLKSRDGNAFTAGTDNRGLFRISLPTGSYSISTSYIGFNKNRQHIVLNRDLFAEIKMSQTAIPIQEVVVRTSPLSDELNHKGSHNIISVSSSDPFAQINSLPGISGTSVNGDLHVNGGQSDENLILLDGIPIYHSQHNNSLLAQFNGDAVQKVSFYDSFIPARYEGRLSSVTDVRIKGGDAYRHNQYLSLDLPSASAAFDGPVIKDRFTYMLSGRHSWLDFMENLFSDNPELNRSFWDITGKLVYGISDKTSLQALVYRSEDSFNDSINGYKNEKVLQWGSGIYSLSLNTAGRFTNVSTFAYSEYKNRIFAPMIDIPSNFHINEGMNKYIVKSDFGTSLDGYVDLSWGIKFSHERFNLLASKDTVENNHQHISQISAYLNTRIRITRNVNAGVALNFVSYLPEGHRNFFSLQPRFTLRYVHDDKNLFSFDFSRMEQFYHNICLGEIPIPTDLRMPSINGFAPSSSLHCELGWKHIEKSWRFSISTFYKRRFDILGVRYDIDMEQDGWHRFIMDGDGCSYGIKLHALGSWDRWMFNMSYTFSRSYEWFGEYDSDRKNPTLHDLPHIFNYAASYKINDKSLITLGGYIKSGMLENIFSDYDSYSGLIDRRERRKFNYRADMNFSSSKSLNNRGVTLFYKLGLYNIIGRPKENEIIDLYTLETKKHCLQYFSLKLKF